MRLDEIDVTIVVPDRSWKTGQQPPTSVSWDCWSAFKTLYPWRLNEEGEIHKTEIQTSTHPWTLHLNTILWSESGRQIIDIPLGFLCARLIQICKAPPRTTVLGMLHKGRDNFKFLLANRTLELVGVMRRRVQVAVERSKGFEPPLATKWAHIATAIKGRFRVSEERWSSCGWCDMSFNRNGAISVKSLHGLGDVMAGDVRVNFFAFDMMGDAWSRFEHASTVWVFDRASHRPKLVRKRVG